MPKDEVEISGMSYEEKIKELQKLHDQTDYSGMTLTEKYALINERMETYFPDYWAINSGLLGSISTAPDGTWTSENPICAALFKEVVREYHDAGIDFSEVPRGEAHREALYPDMTDEEVREAVLEKYNGGTMTDRAAALTELNIMGMVSGFAAGSAIDAMRAKLVMQVTGSSTYAGLSTGSALLEGRIASIAAGAPMSWGEIAKITIDAFGDTDDNKAYYEEMMNEMLETILGKAR